MKVWKWYKIVYVYQIAKQHFKILIFQSYPTSKAVLKIARKIEIKDRIEDKNTLRKYEQSEKYSNLIVLIFFNSL